MQQIGIVRATDGESATVEVSRKSACEGCHAKADGECSACVSLGGKTVSTKAHNGIGAKVGDRVMLESESSTVLLYAAAVFLFPLLLGVIGYFVGGLIEGAAPAYIGAVLGFVLAFIIVWATLNRYAKRHSAVRITQILTNSGEIC